MTRLILVLLLILAPPSLVSGATLEDAVGVIRVFGDASSWMSACFVVGDGSWAVTAREAVIERVGPDTERTIRYPVFISPYTGRAYQCELKATDKDLGIALLKLPEKGLPAAPLAKLTEFSTAAYKTLGQMMSGEPLGNRWPTQLYGIIREKKGGRYKLRVGEWDARQIFVTDIGKYKWAFLSETAPEKPVPNGSMAARGPLVVGMYLNRLTITGGARDVVFGRCAMSTEIARYLGDRGIDTAALYDPPAPTATRIQGADAAFQLQAVIYSLIGARRPALAVDAARALVKLIPADAQTHMVLGMALMGAGKFEQARESLDQAFKLDPNLPTLRTNRGLALIGLNKLKEGETELLKAVSEAPMDPRPVTALADFYASDDKTLDQALQYAKKAATMSAGSPAAQLLVARIEKHRKNYSAATSAIAKALKMAPDWWEAWYALGATYEEAGDKDSAEKAYRKLVEKQPKNPNSLITLASFLADEGKKDEPLELIGKVRDLNPPEEVMEAAQNLEDLILGKKPAEKPLDTDDNPAVHDAHTAE